MKPIVFCLSLVLAAMTLFVAPHHVLRAQTDEESPYMVIWNTPSDSWNDSVPLGNGEVGVNARINRRGEIELLLARTDSFDDYGRLIKVGGVKIAPFSEPLDTDGDKANPPAADNESENLFDSFTQTLDTKRGMLTAKFGPKEHEVRLRLWVDAHRPVVVVQIESQVYITPKASLQLWRTEPGAVIEKPEVSDLFWDETEPIKVFPDTILTSAADETAMRIGWYHANTPTKYFDAIGRTQGLDDFAGRVNPLAGRVSGAILTAAAPLWKDERTLYSRVGLRHRFEIAVTSLETTTPEEWTTATAAILANAAAADIATRSAEHLLWWSEFQARSWIELSPRPDYDKKPLTESHLFSANDRALRIGLDSSGGSRFQGQLRNFRIHDLPLSPAKVKKVADYCKLRPVDLRALSQYIALSDEQLDLIAAYYKMTKAELAEAKKNFTPEQRRLEELSKDFTLHDIDVLQRIKNFKALSPYFEYAVPGHTIVNESKEWEFPSGFTLEISFRLNERPTERMRLFDKINPEQTDGFALDLTPEGNFQLIRGERTDLYTTQVQPKVWHHAALTVSENDQAVFYLDGAAFPSNRGEQSVPGEESFVVTRANALQRYMDACAGRGNYPIKFNGSLFTVPPDASAVSASVSESAVGNPDYRRWGPGYWWQNSRLPYLSKTKAGDYDLMKPFFDMYAAMLPLCIHRTSKYFGFAGAYYPECVYPWGDVFPETYGTQPWNERDYKLQLRGWHKYEWVSGLELIFMMLDYYDYTADEAFLTEKILPAADAVLPFFDHYYKTDDAGKLVMNPSQALETWWKCTNPMPEIAGLTAVTEKLLTLGADKIGAERHAAFTALAAKIPPLPTRIDPQTGSTLLAPAAAFEDKNNIENPELYAVYPFRLLTFNTPNVDLALRAFELRQSDGPRGWQQDELFATTLGQADEAHRLIVERAQTKNPVSRFPVFWGPNYDWVPDQDHGAILTAALQNMIMQTDGDKIYLLPAFPREWDVNFKLHAPKNTVITGKTVRGKIVSLTVTPSARESDVIVAKPPKSERF